MTNHPGRNLWSAKRMTPEELRDLIERADITQTRAADIIGISLRTMQQYIAGDRPIPLSVSRHLCAALIIIGKRMAVRQWLHPDIARVL